MDKLIFTAVSGAERTLKAQQVRANNLANIETAGFRANLEVAATQAMQQGYGYDSMHLAKTQADTISTRAGSVRETGRPLDVALNGNGYLAVQYGEGEAYTRAGSIAIDANGALSVNGHPLLGEGGPIVLPPHQAVEIGNDGTISVLTEGATLMQPVDKLRLVNAEGAELTKNEAGLIVSRQGDPLEADPNVSVRGRALEGSNVSAVEEMVAVMSLNRSFEIQMKLFKASDSMNDVGNRLIGA
ncbi:flagellar basal body rod protein FlgF [Massilia sp. IC2-477]|uniref:flagellar basal body rod protein FlgF n=1 Tax=unclassified Massilia TaxID=2609279 RepID=UPI001D107938|nr:MULTISPECIES: flagellar basal body rod protein FlgF [unclassified Massilia]MCC2954306.1 flagellar basal body rod protein FlgF [Massilia sp. IC2-477]MCC2971745.1 flagellar basal body rod protein FlgF [Massilia sp. IC2-476]